MNTWFHQNSISAISDIGWDGQKQRITLKIFLYSSVILQLNTHTFYFQTLLGNDFCFSAAS